MKGGHLVGSNNNTHDASEKGTGCSIPVLSVCGDVDNGQPADRSNGDFYCWFSSKVERISI